MGLKLEIRRKLEVYLKKMARKWEKNEKKIKRERTLFSGYKYHE